MAVPLLGRSGSAVPSASSVCALQDPRRAGKLHIVVNLISITLMNGVVYSTKNSDSVGGQSTVIIEIWIEQIRICINEVAGAFTSAKPRAPINHFGTFNIDDQICQSIREYVDKKASFEQINSKIFSALKQRLVGKKTQHNRIV